MVTEEELEEALDNPAAEWQEFKRTIIAIINTNGGGMKLNDLITWLDIQPNLKDSPWDSKESTLDDALSELKELSVLGYAKTLKDPGHRFVYRRSSDEKSTDDLKDALAIDEMEWMELERYLAAMRNGTVERHLCPQCETKNTNQYRYSEVDP